MAKGKQGEHCNRAACQQPNSAHHYNSAMNAYYCMSCAIKIEASAVQNGMSFFEGLGITKENLWRYR